MGGEQRVSSSSLGRKVTSGLGSPTIGKGNGPFGDGIPWTLPIREKAKSNVPGGVSSDSPPPSPSPVSPTSNPQSIPQPQNMPALPPNVTG